MFFFSPNSSRSLSAHPVYVCGMLLPISPPTKTEKPVRQKYPNKKPIKKSWSLFCIGQLLPSTFFFLIPRDNTLKITDFSLYKLASITNNFLVKNELLHPLPFLSAGPPPNWNLYRSCVYCYSLCEFICAYVLLYLEDTVSSELSITSVT